MFFNSMILGTMISISAYSWMSMWMGLEINLLSIIPILNSTKNMFSSESSMKYFITQAMASMILLFTVILMLSLNEFISPQMNQTFMIMLNSALLTKIGAAPFHFWFPEVMEGLSWMNCFILLTWQKIAPMILMMNNKLNMNFMIIIIMFSLIISAFMSMNQMSLRKIMTFSSINHIAWMLSSMMISYSIWMIYFIIYSIISYSIILMFHYNKSFYINQLILIMNKNKMTKLIFMLNFLSLGGLPPFIGFLPKWLTINWLINQNMYILSFTLIIFTLITLFIYTRIIFSSIILYHNEIKIKQNYLNNYMFMLFNMIFILMLIITPMIFNLM
uniref:NADH-ubiquinone oxidoreductase chain 2 n=1 Tax=Usechus lacerta TaxID=296008 RepID=A0A343A3S3_9CUCU|nr:NADH dehydrogenase subunit 2 [Usechus lacerta]AOY39201.1 NADH dehydrogenase subunit 2 [Usechus lacerta]